MNIIGIIAEYNPFHMGHKYQFEQAKEAANADFCVAVMSGNFVQRGEGAIIDKFLRAKAAILSGVDLVVELPVDFSLQTAERFAFGGVYILNAIGVSHISFGCENSEVDDLYKIASFLVEENSEYNNFLKAELDKGLSFASSRQNALSKTIGDSLAEIISSSNNILAVEYLKALIKINSNIVPIPIKRIGANHNSNEATNCYSSAQNIREIIKTKGIDFAKAYLTKESYEILKDNQNYVFTENFDKIVLHSLLRADNLENYPDVSEGLGNRIKNFAYTSSSISELIEKVKTKRYAYTKISRILMNYVLGISKSNLSATPKYLRVLGFNQKGRLLLNKFKKEASLPIIAKPASAYSYPKDLISEIELDFNASDIYCLANNTFPNKKGRADILSAPIILP